MVWIDTKTQDDQDTVAAVLKLMADHPAVRAVIEDRIELAFQYFGERVDSESDTVDFCRMVIDGHV